MKLSLQTLISIPLLTLLISVNGQNKITAYTNAVIIDGNGRAPIENGNVIVQGDKILSVGNVDVPKGAEVINLTGKTVMPGIADMHVHLVGGWDGLTVDLLSYERYMNSLLYAGVTTVLDVGNIEPYILQLIQEIKAGRLAGPNIYSTGPLLDGPDPAWPPISIAVNSNHQVPGIVKSLKSKGFVAVKAYGGLSYSNVRSIVKEANKLDMKVIVDQWSQNGSYDLAITGITAFAHMPSRRVITDEVISAMKSNNMFNITTLAVTEYGSGRRFENIESVKNPNLKPAIYNRIKESDKSLGSIFKILLEEITRFSKMTAWEVTQ